MMTTENPSMSSQIILPQPGNDREREVFAAMADRDKEIAERIEEIDGALSPNTLIALGSILNYLENPGFELGDTDSCPGWTFAVSEAGTAEIVRDEKASGLQSLCCSEVIAAIDDAYAYQTITAPGAGNYVLQFFTKGDGVNDGRYKVNESGQADPIPMTQTGVTADAWTLVVDTFVVATAADVQIVLRAPNVNNASAWFDDILIARAITYANLDQIVYQMYRQILQALGGWDG